MNGIRIDVLESEAELRVLVPHWETLAAEALEPNPFYEHWMLLPALAAYGRERFACVAVWRDGTLGALLPMERQPRYRGLPLPALRSWRHRNMMLCTPLLRAGGAVDCLAALLAAAPAPLLELEYIPAGGAFHAALVEAASAAGCSWSVDDAYARALLVRDRDPRALFNSRLRNNLRRAQGRLAAIGVATPVRLAPGAAIAPWVDDFLRLEASGWKGRAGSALACRPDDRRFVAEAFAEAHRRGRLEIGGLDLDAQPLARQCLFTAGDGAYLFKIAYEEAYASCAPGILAEVEHIRRFMETPGPRWIDSYTAPDNETIGRLWKDRRTVQRLVLGTRGVGRLAVAALPLLRLAKQSLGRLKPKRARSGGALGSRPAPQPRLQGG